MIIAQMLGVTYLSFAVGLLFNRKYYKKNLKKLIDNEGYMMLGGFISLFFGVIVINIHGEWTNDWTSLITLVGWLGALKGVMLLAFPNAMDFFKPMLDDKHLNKFMLPLVVVLGAVFTYFGFFG